MPSAVERRIIRAKQVHGQDFIGRGGTPLPCAAPDEAVAPP